MTEPFNPFHPMKPGDTVMYEGQEYTLHVTTGDSCYGYVGEDGLMHEVVRNADGDIIRERHTPFAQWNRGEA